MQRINLSLLCLAVAAVLPGAGAARADGSGLTYVEAAYVNVDVDQSVDVAGIDISGRVSSDDDSGFRIGGSWDVHDGWLIYGEYGEADQDLGGTLTGVGGPERISGDFEVERARLGIGYGWEIAPGWTYIGRIGWDWVEFSDFDVGGASLDDTDDSGVDVESLFWWNVGDWEFEGRVRYSEIGDYSARQDEFDNGALFGAAVRYFPSSRYALQVGYESGDIKTFNIGVRVTL